MEIERKYLVTNDSYRQMAIARYHIRQGYISREKTGTVRIRICLEEDVLTGEIINSQAYITIKGRPAIGHFARYEWEQSIDSNDAEELMLLCQGTIIDKTRWIVPAVESGLKWEIDEFHDKHEGLQLAEIELEFEEQVVELPSFIGKEVTDDPQYYNANM